MRYFTRDLLTCYTGCAIIAGLTILAVPHGLAIVALATGVGLVVGIKLPDLV